MPAQNGRLDFYDNGTYLSLERATCRSISGQCPLADSCLIFDAAEKSALHSSHNSQRLPRRNVRLVNLSVGLTGSLVMIYMGQSTNPSSRGAPLVCYAKKPPSCGQIASNPFNWHNGTILAGIIPTVVPLSGTFA